MKTVPKPACRRRSVSAVVDASTRGFRIPPIQLKKSIVHIVVVLVSLFCLHAGAQISHSHRKENFDVHKFWVEVVEIAAPVQRVSLKNIQGLKVIDARADTSAIGFMQKKTIEPFFGSLNNATQNQTEQKINKRPTFIALDNGLQKEAGKYVAETISFPVDTSFPGILMVIKKLWLSDELNFNEPAYSSGRYSGPASRDIWTSGADVKIEFYLQDKSDYYPLYRYDTVITEPMTISEYAPEFVSMALGLSVQKLQQMDNKITAIKTRRKFSLQEINQHNENEFNIPVLTDGFLKKGVYMSFDEFKNNNPSQMDYELKQDKLTDIVYIKQPNGTALPARGVWGYCDGKNAFIKSANNFFLLQRSANAFYIFGAKNIKRTETSSSSAGTYYSGNTTVIVPTLYNNSKALVQLEPFQLDWSTGKLY